MRVNLDIPDADVPALAVQLGDRFVARADGVTNALHVTSAVQAWASQELVAARKLAAAAEVKRLEEDPDATAKQREDAALAEYRARR